MKKLLSNQSVNEDSRLRALSRAGKPEPRQHALTQQIREELGNIRRAGRFRRTRRVEGRPGPHMRVDGREVLMLASANYLDLAGDPRVIAAAQMAAETAGCAAGGARLISGNLELHEALEGELAHFLGTQAALLFSTGYMANLGVLPTLAGPDDVIVSDSLNHASIIDACRLSEAPARIFRHGDADDLRRVLADCVGFRRRILVLDGVYSMDGDVADLRELIPIARAHDMIVVLDDTHGIGVLGSSGRGTAQEQGQEVDIQIGNLGKALGSFGAWVACGHDLRTLLVNQSRSFIFTCAPTPASVGAAREALRIAQSEPWRRVNLLVRAAELRRGLADAGFETGSGQSQIVPAITEDNEKTMALCEHALERGVYAQGIRYPSVPQGSARIRFTPICSHTSEEIKRVVQVFSEARKKLA